jgi:hypothetical protein
VVRRRIDPKVAAAGFAEKLSSNRRPITENQVLAASGLRELHALQAWRPCGRGRERRVRRASMATGAWDFRSNEGRGESGEDRNCRDGAERSPAAKR